MIYRNGLRKYSVRFRLELHTNQAKISQSSSGLLDKVMDVQNIRVEDVYGNAIAGFGGSGDIISIHLDCEWPSVNPYMYVLLDDGKFKFTVSAAMKNEAF